MVSGGIATAAGIASADSFAFKELIDLDAVTVLTAWRCDVLNKDKGVTTGTLTSPGFVFETLTVAIAGRCRLNCATLSIAPVIIFILALGDVPDSCEDAGITIRA
jgi:hypothetical protein